MKRTWRKAIRKLLDKANEQHSAAYPDVFYRLTPSEISKWCYLVVEELDGWINSVPTDTVNHSRLLNGRRSIYSHVAGLYFIF